MLTHILEEPLWLQIWLAWLGIVNTACLLFLRSSHARWVLVAWVGNLITMTLLLEWNGYNRLLGLSHVIWWTPLLVVLFRRRVFEGPPGALRSWLAVLFLTNLTSLVVDTVDVARYLLGDRG